MVGWFEIATTDMDRAMKFYETVFNLKLSRQTMGNLDMAWFPWPEDAAAPGAGGSLICMPEHYKPSADGTIVYFSSQTGDLSDELNRVEAAGGKVLKEKSLITPEIGYMGMFLDTEGNRIALHSKK